MSDLKVLTLNVWGIPNPVICKMKNVRIKAIGEALSKGEYDILMFQEVWMKVDYDTLYEKLSSAYQYNHYFYSGMIGSGLCVFSKGPIVNTHFFLFPLNGYAHKIHHGDWFGGKGVGLCKINHNGLAINVYTTHLHAEYCCDNDEYKAHRLSQAFEVSQIIRLTSGQCDIAILGGDLNLVPDNVGVKIIRANSQLLDAWSEKELPALSNIQGNTCSIPTNSFVSLAELKQNPDGVRIDYILYKSQSGKAVRCLKSYFPLDKMPGNGYSYSDHEAVVAVFNISDDISKDQEESSNSINTEDLMEYIAEATSILDGGISRTVKHRNSHLVFAILCFVLYYFINNSYDFYIFGTFMMVFQLLLGLYGFYCVWVYVVISKIEEQGYIETRNGIKTSLGCMSRSK